MGASMTLIASFTTHRVPVLFGDLLISGKRPEHDPQVSIPAARNAQNVLRDDTEGKSILGLRQKINIISDTCAIAWAGAGINAHYASEELRAMATVGNLSKDAIRTLLLTATYLRDEATALAVLFLDELEVHVLKHNMFSLNGSSLGSTLCQGSGMHALVEFARMVESAEMRSSGHENNTATAIGQALLLGGVLLQTEYYGGEDASTLREKFGGGYEIAFFDGRDRITKLDEVTFLFWEAWSSTHEVKLSVPIFMVKQKYEREHLLIKSAKVKNDPTTNGPTVVDLQWHAVPPIFTPLETLDRSAAANIDLNSPTVCHCVLITSGSGAKSIYTEMHYYPPGLEPGITLQHNGDRLTFSVREETQRHFYEMLHDDQWTKR